MAEKQLTSTKDLKRVLGFWDLMAIGVGSIIGSGIMSLTGIGIERTGRSIFIAFIIGGFIDGEKALINQSAMSKIKFTGQAFYNYGGETTKNIGVRNLQVEGLAQAIPALKKIITPTTTATAAATTVRIRASIPPRYLCCFIGFSRVCSTILICCRFYRLNSLFYFIYTMPIQ